MQNTREKVATATGKITDTKFAPYKSEVHIFPFVLRNGFQNVSQRGFEPKGSSTSAFSFFQKVFTGLETITATWKNSTKLNVREADKGTYDYDFQVGDYYKGLIVPGSAVRRLEINDVNGNEDFMAMQEAQEVTIMFSRNAQGVGSTEEQGFELTEDDMFNLYIIPEIFENKWLYISNHTTYTHPQNKNIILTEVVFTSLKDSLEKSGRALEQYVQYAAPGEPYAMPTFDPDGNVVLSQTTMNPEAVKYLQVELQGASALSSIIVFGRQLYWDDENRKWYTSPSKILLPTNLLNPQANHLNKTSAPTKNFYFFPDEQVEVRATKEWLTSEKDKQQAFSQVKNMGAFTMGIPGDWSGFTHCSNPIQSSTGLHIDYISKSWNPISTFARAGSDWKTKDSSGNPYTTDTIVYDRYDDMRKLLIKNGMAFMSQLEIPLSFTSSRPYMWSSIPIIGFWTRWFGDKAIFPNTENVKNIHLGYFIDCDIATMIKQAYEEPALKDKDGNPLEVIGSLQMFNGQNTPPLLTPQATNTTIAFELTDKVSFTDPKYTGVVGDMNKGIDTVYLSQLTNEQGQALHNDDTPLLMNCSNGNLEPHISSADGWVIDAVMVQALHIGKVKLSCFGKYTYNNLSNPLFTQTVMSNSMFDNENIRNWTTSITLGCWDSSWSSGDITWPLQPQKDVTEYETTIDFTGKNIDFETSSVAGTFTQLYAKIGDVIQENLPMNWAKENSLVLEDKISQIAYNGDTNNYEYSYQQYGCQNRQEFINKYDTIQFILDGSVCQLWVNDGFWYHNYYECPISGKRIIAKADDFIYDDEQDAYIWSRKQGIGSFNSSYNNPLAGITDDVITPYITFCQGFMASGSLYVRDRVNGGWSQNININIELGQDSFVIKLTEDTSFYGYGETHYPEPEDMIPTTRLGMISSGSFRNCHLVSQIYIPKWILTERVVPPTPTGLYLEGGSNPLVGSSSTAGEDEYAWVLMRDGQQVQDTPIWTLQNVEPASSPFSVRVAGSKCYIKWNAGGTTGDYKLRLVANLEGDVANVIINAKII